MNVPGQTWARLTPFNRVLALEQFLADGTPLTAIGELLFAWDQDPRVTTRLTPRPFMITAEGAQFQAAMPYIWVLFRLRRPELNGEAWSATAVYASGQQVYFTASAGRGNFYDCSAATTAGESPTTTPAKWSLVALPYLFRQYLIHGGYCDWLTADGQTDKAERSEAGANAMLELEADKLQRQQFQVNRMNFRS